VALVGELAPALPRLIFDFGEVPQFEDSWLLNVEFDRSSREAVPMSWDCFSPGIAFPRYWDCFAQYQYFTKLTFRFLAVQPTPSTSDRSLGCTEELLTKVLAGISDLSGKL
jgi:hypothetical protein